MARSDELDANSEKQAKSSGSSPPGDLNLKEAEKALSRASLSGASGGDGSAIKKSCEFKRKLLSLEISSNGISPRGDLYLEEAEKVLSRASLSGTATDGTATIDKRLEKSEARKRCSDLLQKAAIEYCSANLLANAAQCYERAAELLIFRRVDHTSFTILSKASKCYKKNVQYDKAEQVTLKLIDMATKTNDVSRIAKFNCELANIYVLKQLNGEASKHYERAYTLNRVEDKHFYCCMELVEKQANFKILQNDFEAAAKYFVMIVENCQNHGSMRSNSVKYFVRACLSFLVENPKKSRDYIEEKVDIASLSYSGLYMVKGIIDGVQENNYDSFKSLIRRKYSYILDTDHTLRDIVLAIEKKYFLVENGIKKKHGKLPAADDDINLENLLEDEKIDRADDNKSKLISIDNSQTAQSSRNSSESSEKEEEGKEKGDHDRDNDVDDDIDLR
ncbi:MAG: hypothetical protein MHMPM18_001144 [Marteilia pararefringens]